MSRLQAEIARLADGIGRLTDVYVLIRKGKDMGKLSALAERMRDTKIKLEAEADKLAARLDDIDVAAPKAFDRGHAFLDAQESEVADIEDTLRQLSNLPLERSTGSADDSKPKSAPAVADQPKPFPGQ